MPPDHHPSRTKLRGIALFFQCPPQLVLRTHFDHLARGEVADLPIAAVDLHLRRLAGIGFHVQKKGPIRLLLQGYGGVRVQDNLIEGVRGGGDAFLVAATSDALGPIQRAGMWTQAIAQLKAALVATCEDPQRPATNTRLSAIHASTYAPSSAASLLSTHIAWRWLCCSAARVQLDQLHTKESVLALLSPEIAESFISPWELWLLFNQQSDTSAGLITFSQYPAYPHVV